MATGNSISIANLRQTLWRKQLFADVRDLLWIDKFIGESDTDMIQEMTDLKKNKGDTIRFGLGMKLSGSGVTGDSELEGQEEVMTDYDESISINQIRNAVRTTGNMDEQKNVYNMRVSAKNRLASWMAEYIEQDVFYKLCGYTGGTFANTPSAAAASRSVFAGGQSAVGSVTSTMKMDTKVLDKAKQVARLASPRVRPLKIKGKDYYVCILHPYDITNLRQDSVWNQAQREANVRGSENPIFSGAEAIWNGLIIHEHEYIYRTDDGSDSAYVARNILCGQQAGVIAWGKPVNWVEKTFNYDNQLGVSCGAIFGCIKPMFNSVDYGVVTMFTASDEATTA